ncbi:phenylalanyl-tRNA synthetase subunit beta [Bifidobacterium actinocoloniiforme DSM 22766]|uniref:Phenylalanine--tRNA ligase beta subunit n=1 Tax=Bifidobacterium actinocoloniiforme DSM 22766 TaxID=1437605 RepID=A0A086Z127_9BIFI|nr:phenylalanine--tRNA ligase subunit beta [Bifidobacterium actinocoloniiforme]AKV55402.1 phenylalanyl-tRNA synthetase subunit beta [Bifidobacterium actinocoloniiforme DSM 22766]KFI40227.1 phenylalanyl-tRNA synthetase subunit beta [Bifidobacterium actinocoloniiforme DSM 22766]
MPMVDIDWLKEHVQVPEGLTYEQLAKDLVKVGLEEEEIHRSTVTGPIVVGYVVSAEPEPQKNGKVINWCQVDVGPVYNAVDEAGNKVPRGIVCGAPNMAAGEKVVVTLPGAVLPGDFRIEPRKTYGHISDGMCASERELGLGSDHDGIILLRKYGFTKEECAALQPGDDAMGLLHLNNPVLEINITPDRGYALSYRGVAREYHHSTGAAYTDPVAELDAKLSAHADASQAPVQVEIDDQAPIHGQPGCDRYYLRAVRGYEPGSPTPNWMRRRLVRAGMRCISLPVDVTNYAMLDLGQPLHAYDMDKIEGPIVVRRAKAGERLTTLDGKDRELNPEDLLITDSPQGKRGSRVLGLAGVMGGLYGEVTAETRNILIEAAHFDTVSIARTARRHKLPSEASKRFERGVDWRMQPAAAQMVADLLAEYGSAQPDAVAVDVDRTHDLPGIDFPIADVKRLVDLDAPVERIVDILTDVGCKTEPRGEGRLMVTPPSWRPDLTQSCDLVEEVARLVGYDQIPVSVPSPHVAGRVGLTEEQRRQRWVADTLAEYGLTEVLNYPFVGPEDFKAFGYEEDDLREVSVELANPLAADRPYLRRELLLPLANTVQRNIRRGNEDVRLFELGSIYLRDPQAPSIPALPGGRKPSEDELRALDAGLPTQRLHVAALLTGNALNDGWLGDKRPVDWTDAVESARRVLDRLGADYRLEQPAAEDAPQQWHPGRVAQVIVAEGRAIGVVGELHPRVNQALGLPEHTAAFELDLDGVFEGLDFKPLQAKPISTFPPVKQDLAFTVPDSVDAAQLSEAIEEAAGDLLESIQLFDVFTGDQIGQGVKSLAFAVTFRAPDRTLTSQESEKVRAAIVERTEALGARLRA